MQTTAAVTLDVDVLGLDSHGINIRVCCWTASCINLRRNVFVSRRRAKGKRCFYVSHIIVVEGACVFFKIGFALC